jgi:uncharacterized repeat protein (TIGR01451 family)
MLRRRLMGPAGILGLMVCLLSPGGHQAHAAPGDPFPEGPGLVFVAQAVAQGQPTTLYQAVQGTGEITFVRQGTDDVGYNAMGFHESDRYLYAINNNDGLVRIGQGGDVTPLGQVGLPTSTAPYNYNQGTFGQGDTADILYVRQSSPGNNSLYAVDVVNRTSRRIALSTGVPNLSDMVWRDGYIWGVYGEGSRLYRIDPETGEVLSVPLPAGIPTDPYGAQWLYGNGNLGISNNRTGTVYQLQLNNPTSSSPSVTVISSTRGPANTQNDGASSLGQPTDLGITKEGPETWEPGAAITYTLRVHNYGPGASSGWIVRDTLPEGLSDPATTTDGCRIVTENGQNFVECAGGELANGQDAPAIVITGTAPDTAGTDCVEGALSDTAEVTGNEQDDNPANNTDSSTACPAEQEPPSFTVSKEASVSAPDSVSPGDRVTYTVTVRNTGTQDYTEENPASFTDDLSDVTDDAQVDPASLTGGAELGEEGITWSGPLAAGAIHTVTYAVVVNDPVAGNGTLRNAVTPGATGTCVSDEACSVETPVRQFNVRKTASPAEAGPGDTVTYRVTVTNTGGVPFTTATPASFTDNLTDVLDDARYNDDATGGATVTGTELAWSGALDVDEQVVITYSVTVNDPATGDGGLRNVVTAGESGTCAAVSACTTEVPVVTPDRRFDVRKTVTPGEAGPGDRVTYEVTVTNTGEAAFTEADPATFTDDLSDVLDDARYNGDATGGATVTGTELEWSGPIGVGQNVVITYSVTVNDPATGDGNLRNSVTPGTGGTCAGASACATHVTVVTTPPQDSSLTLRKRVESDGPFSVGDRVEYSYTVTNTGDTELDAVAVEDDLVSPVDCDDTTLAPNESTTCEGTYEITEDSLENCDPSTVPGMRGGDGGGYGEDGDGNGNGNGNGGGGNGGRTCRITNTATATGTDPSGDTVTSGSARATITVREGGHRPPCKDHCYGKDHGHGKGHGGRENGGRPGRH